MPTPTPTPTPPPPNFNTVEYRNSDGPRQHGAITAYNEGATGAGIIIGIIDSGINTTSPEFAGRISAQSRDLAGNRGLQDQGGHGSAVASIAAAARNNIDVHGIAFDATLLVLRTDDPGSCATSGSGSDDDGCIHSNVAIANALDHARVSGAKVVNISLGGSAPTSRLRNAIANATAAGIVVVVSAGNDGRANPDAFSSGLADNGNGLVIISGSVDSAGTISGFSNRAGNRAGNFLAALGNRVQADDHVGDTFLWSGTSFSAPQISGAAALLAEAFPNLTGAQIVQLLLTSATDAGASGVDSVYGNGILNIANAFQPQGGSSLAGSRQAVNLSDIGGQTSAAMGDAGARGQNVGAVILDGFDRAFALNLAHDLEAATPQLKLTNALSSRQRHMSASGGPVQLSVSIAQGQNGTLRSDNLRLTQDDAGQSKMIAASIISSLNAKTKLAFGYRQSADTLTRQLTPTGGAAFLVAPSPLAERGFDGQVQSALAIRREFAGFGVTASAESGASYVAARQFDFVTGVQRHKQAFSGIGLGLDKQIGVAALRLNANWLGENSSVLGARFSDIIGNAGAQSWFIDADARFNLNDLIGNGWKAGMSWRQGWTSVNSAALLTGGALKSSSFAFDVSKAQIFGNADSFALRFAQPLRVNSGGLTLDLPVSYSYDTLQTEFGQRTLNLAPDGQELVGEMVYAMPLWNGFLNTNIFWRQQPGHIADAGDDVGAAVRFNVNF